MVLIGIKYERESLHTTRQLIGNCIRDFGISRPSKAHSYCKATRDPVLEDKDIICIANLKLSVKFLKYRLAFVSK